MDDEYVGQCAGTIAFIAQRLPRMRINLNLYLSFDPIVHNTDPAVDVVMLLDLALASKDTIIVENFIKEQTGRCGASIRPSPISSHSSTISAF